MANAYGYCVGQTVSAYYVERQFPDLAPAMERARILFKAGTDDACARLLPMLVEAVGEEKVDELRSQVVMGVSKSASAQPRSAAEAFIAEVEGRAEWNIRTPTLETLLSVRYLDEPAGEIRARHVQRFVGRGDPKLLGTEVNLTLPRSWLELEGDRPHIVRKWVSKQGTGLDTIMLAVFEGEPDTPSDWAEVALRGDLAEITPDGATLMGADTFELEGLTGLRSRMRMTMDRVDVTVDQIQESYMLALSSGQMVSVMCSVGVPEAYAASLESRFAAVEPVCRQVVNSMVLPQLY